MMLALFLQQNQPDMEQLQRYIAPMMGVFFIFYLIGEAIVIIPCWFICKKAGFSPWLSLLCLIPGVGQLVLLYILAFADWRVSPALSQGYLPQRPYPPQPPYPPNA